MPDQTLPIPRPEHPRPESFRQEWVNLNGQWDFAFDPENAGEQNRWYRSSTANDPFHLQITVPFPWESKLSGVCSPEYLGAGWYRRRITIPSEWEEKGLGPVLRFEAVDWNAKVWIDGRFAGEHDGGYSPFEIDLRPFLKNDAPTGPSGDLPARELTVTVRAWDVCAADTPLGKQTRNWYTHSSGIWQTVWLEGRPSCFVQQVHFEPDLSARACHATITVQVDEPGDYTIEISPSKEDFTAIAGSFNLPLGISTVKLDVIIRDPFPWSPTDPYLYETAIELRRGTQTLDKLESYFGMREIRRGTWKGSDFEYVLLNGEPIYLLGVLDQAFYPDGLHTYPSDEAIRADVEAARAAGYNMLRCHIKINEPRYYYWADRLGMLVMADIPSPSIYTPRSRQNWEQTLRDAIERDFNHPSIITWVLFNETWGLEEHHREAGWTWIKQMVHLCHALDSTRLVEDNSPCNYDHVLTDLNSWHFYINHYDRAVDHINHVVASSFPGSSFNYVGGHVQGTEPLLNSEYGGIGAGMGDADVSYCLKYLTSALRRHPRVVGYVYTELSDIEWEHNGIVNYNRSEKEFGYEAFVPGMSVADVNRLDYIGIDVPPCQTLTPSAQAAFPLFFAQHGPKALAKVQIRWKAAFCDSLGNRATIQEGEHSIEPARYTVCPAGEIQLQLPSEPGLLTLAVEASDDGGRILNRNYANVEVFQPGLPAVEEEENCCVLRWAPGDFSETDWDSLAVLQDGIKISAGSPGYVEYEIAAPDTMDLSSLRGLRLVFEAGACTASRRLDWKQVRGALRYPQTHKDAKYGSDLRVTINGIEVLETHLPDDPADARGVLSHHAEKDPGSYGFLVDVALEEAQMAAVIERASGRKFVIRLENPGDAQHKGGLSLYGRRMGAYPVEPSLVIQC